MDFGCLVSAVDFLVDFLGPFALEKQAGKNPLKNPAKNPRFSRELFDFFPSFQGFQGFAWETDSLLSWWFPCISSPVTDLPGWGT